MVITSPSLIKKITITVIMVVGIFFSAKSFAQESNLDFSCKVDSVNINGIVNYEISVTIIKGIAPFSIRLYEDLGRKGFSIIDRKDNVINQDVKFVFPERKKYVIVVDNNDNSVLKQLNLIKK